MGGPGSGVCAPLGRYGPHQCPGSLCPQWVPREVPALEVGVDACEYGYCEQGVYTQDCACRWSERSPCTAAYDTATLWPSTDTLLTVTTCTWCWSTAAERCPGGGAARAPSHLLPAVLSSSAPVFHLHVPVPTPGLPACRPGSLDCPRLSCVHLCRLFCGHQTHVLLIVVPGPT